jgi:hypothetical protein
MKQKLTMLMAPNDGGAGGGGSSITPPAGHPSGGATGMKTGASPKDIFEPSSSSKSSTQQTQSTINQDQTRKPQITAPLAGSEDTTQQQRQTQQTQDDGQQQQSQQGQQQTQQTQAPVNGSTVAMTDAQLAQLAQTLARSVAPVQQTQQGQQQVRPQDMSPEQRAEFERQFHVVRVTPEMFTQIMGYAPEKPEQVTALENFAHSVMRMAAATTLYEVDRRMQEREGKVREQFDPMMKSFQQQRAEAIQNKLFTAHPDLKDFGPLVGEIAKAAKADGISFNTEDEVITFVANKARSLLGTTTPAGSTQGQQSQTQGRQTMPTTSMGGRPGGARSPQTTPATSPKGVFGDLDGSR